ncbi:MAG: N-acetylmuramoyl-L-alanine amidase-like domain-containing protein [Ignavibacteriaceae bacterium]
MKSIIRNIFIIILIPFFLKAQVYSDKDIAICKDKFELAVNKNLEGKPIGDVIAEIGKSFIGTDYAANTLEKGDKEELVINLTGLDCTTFLENALTFARCIKENKTSFTDYQNELQRIRYRDGIINGYPSRLHYFSDWIYDNIKKGIISDVTKETGGEKITFKVNFMSGHPDSYKRLKDNPELIPIIKKQEKEISSREYYYIPKDKAASIENKIHDGDLIAITSNVKGLDINHVGIAVRLKDHRIHLLNAPNVGYKVQASKINLSDYLNKIKKDTGIIILRALNP